MPQQSREQARFLRPEGLCGVEALHATFFEHRYAPHVHETWTVAQVLAGAPRFELEGRWHTAPAGSVFIIPPGVVHNGEPATVGGYSYRVLYLEPQALPGWSGDALPSPGERRPVVVSNAPVSDALTLAHATLLERNARLEQGEVLAAAWQRISKLLRELPQTGRTRRSPHPRIQLARGYIDARWQEDFTLDELASAVGLSPFHLLRTFRDRVGMTPSAYRRALRVNAAQGLLRSGMPAAQAAVACGFYDQAHLNRHFKRVTGVTPGRYVAAADR
ncbi:MAG TPA: AraC family transcriptional regulator [Solirubrobacteraceae bacterium]|nr:AraC family transcriptional regulator [Solirubrobacteraceae bacterium]